MSDDKPRKTLIIKRKRSTATNTPESEENAPAAILRTNKRVLTFDKPKKKQPQPPPKKKKRVNPSVIRGAELNKALSSHSKAWRSMQPLSHDIEKQVFQFIGARHLSASKRVVKALIKKQTNAINYLKNSIMDAPIYDLDDNQTGLVSWERASIAAKRLVRVEAERAAEKRAKTRKRRK
ncbi:ProQ/FINO family protein [Leucothrix pacifica]|uniref:ProQ/FinO domain-containing protein n=1 Tax=Leucothrix pacifica TaxID=1247513 RepID=A0A317CH14_9GAMM|nr:ProQ/FINO family protein [Leucothrix pacifica]PWQ97687.1 hypothetical protein DKW60_09935 [Leucothrix pacifica]